MENKPKEKLNKYLEDYDNDYRAQDRQRDEAADDMRFSVVPGGQWEGFLEETYEHRTKLELDLVNVGVERFLGDFFDNRIDVKYSPDDDATTDDDSELLQGIYRRDSRKGRGKQALQAAISEMARCGFGAIKLATTYEDEEDPEDERQRAVFDHIPNAYNCVAFDCNSKEADKSDANHVTVVFEYEKAAFEKEFPGFEPVPVNISTDRRYFNWYGKNTVFVGHRYEIKKTTVLAHTFINPNTQSSQVIDNKDLELIESELINGGWEKIKSKKINKREVYKTVFSGSDILVEERKISGKLLPVIPFYAYRSYVDGQEFYFGLVRKLKDAQRLFNMEISQAAEVSSGGNRDIPIIDPRSLKGYEAHWAGNIYDKQYLPAAPYTDSKGVAHQVLQGTIPQAQLDSTSAALLEVVGNYIKETTGGQQADITDVDMSGKAIRELVKRANLNTRSVWANIEASIVRLGEVYQSIAEDIYSMPRSIKTLAEDGSEKVVRLMQASLDDQGNMIERNNIKKMKFEVFVSVGAAYESQRGETVETLRSLITEAGESNPQYVPPMFASLIENISGTNMDALKEFNRREMLKMGMTEPKDQKDIEFLQGLTQPDGQEELVKAAAQQQMAEAEELKARSFERIANSKLIEAKTAETIEKIGREAFRANTERIKALKENMMRRTA